MVALRTWEVTLHISSLSLIVTCYLDVLHQNLSQYGLSKIVVAGKKLQEHDMYFV